MTQIQLTGQLDENGRLKLEYDRQQLEALGLAEWPQPERIYFQEKTAQRRPSFQQLVGIMGKLTDENGQPLDAVNFVRDLRRDGP